MVSENKAIFFAEKERDFESPGALFSIDAVSGALKVHRQTLRNQEKKKLIRPLWAGKNSFQITASR